MQKEAFECPEPQAGETLVEPIFGCWEANLSHALMRKPIDICRLRNEQRVIIGNCALSRVLKVVGDDHGLKEGDLVIGGALGAGDRFGYPEKIFGYDLEGSLGFLAKRTKLPTAMLQKIPSDTKYSPRQWTAFGVRYLTAWSNWKVAYGCWRVQLSERDMAAPFVWAWGGGTSLGSVHLARMHGFPATMIASGARRATLVRSLGVEPIERGELGPIYYDEKRFAADGEYRKEYREAEANFAAFVRARTDGLGASIFFDHIGTSVTRATLAALAREGVIATAGWKLGMSISSMRAIECIRRHTHVHTHGSRVGESEEAVAYAERTGWVPPVDEDERVWGFDEVPELSARFHAGEIESYFPMFAANPL